VVADKEIPYAQPIERLEIEGEKALVFVVDEERYYAEEVYQLDKRYVVLPEHWIPHIDPSIRNRVAEIVHRLLGGV